MSWYIVLPRELAEDLMEAELYTSWAEADAIAQVVGDDMGQPYEAYQLVPTDQLGGESCG